MTAIRPVGADEAALLAPLMCQVQALHAQAHPEVFRAGLSEAHHARHLAGALGAPGAGALVAQDAEDRAQGFVTWNVQDHPQTALKHALRIAVIEVICVDATCRGQGIGTRLMRATVDRLHAEGIARIGADYYAFNAASAALMAKSGLTPLRIRAEGTL